MRKIWLLLALLPCIVLASEDTVRAQRVDGPYDVRLEKSVMVPMRDGTRLSTDLYFPVDADGQLPVILQRNPYNKMGARERTPTQESYWWASHGYVFVKQDSRGKYESEGVYSPPHGHEATDGYDTVDWLAEQSWSNGKIGTTGMLVWRRNSNASSSSHAS